MTRRTLTRYYYRYRLQAVLLALVLIAFGYFVKGVFHG